MSIEKINQAREYLYSRLIQLKNAVKDSDAAGISAAKG